MKNKRNFVKVNFVSFFDNDMPKEGYIDIDTIIAVYDEGANRYRIDSKDRAYSVDKESYDKLVGVLYGKTYN